MQQQGIDVLQYKKLVAWHVWRFCFRFYRRTGCKLEFQDVSQDAWAKVLELQDKYDSARGSFKTFLAACLQKALYRKYQPRELRVLSEGDDSKEPLDMGALQLVARLKPKDRRAVALRAIGKWKMHEIAEAMGCTKQCVQGRLARVYRQLREELVCGL